MIEPKLQIEKLNRCYGDLLACTEVNLLIYGVPQNSEDVAYKENIVLATTGGEVYICYPASSEWARVVKEWLDKQE